MYLKKKSASRKFSIPHNIPTRIQRFASNGLCALATAFLTPILSATTATIVSVGTYQGVNSYANGLNSGSIQSGISFAAMADSGQPFLTSNAALKPVAYRYPGGGISNRWNYTSTNYCGKPAVSPQVNAPDNFADMTLSLSPVPQSFVVLNMVNLQTSTSPETAPQPLPAVGSTGWDTNTGPGTWDAQLTWQAGLFNQMGFSSTDHVYVELGCELYAYDESDPNQVNVADVYPGSGTPRVGSGTKYAQACYYVMKNLRSKIYNASGHAIDWRLGSGNEGNLKFGIVMVNSKNKNNGGQKKWNSEVIEYFKNDAPLQQAGYRPDGYIFHEYYSGDFGGTDTTISAANATTFLRSALTQTDASAKNYAEKLVRGNLTDNGYTFSSVPSRAGVNLGELWFTEFNLFNTTSQAHGTWAHALFTSLQALRFFDLSSTTTPQMHALLHASVGNAAFSTIFSNTSGYTMSGFTAPVHAPSSTVAGDLTPLGKAMVFVNQAMVAGTAPVSDLKVANLTFSAGNGDGSIGQTNIVGKVFKNNSNGRLKVVLINLNSTTTYTARFPVSVFTGTTNTFSTRQPESGNGTPIFDGVHDSITFTSGNATLNGSYLEVNLPPYSITLYTN